MAVSIINTDIIRKHPTQAVLTVLGLSGTVLVFLPFVDSDVPVEAFLDLLDELGWMVMIGPCVVLPFAISAGYLRWLLTGELSRWENAVGYALALMVVVLFSLLVLLLWWESDLRVRDLPFFASLALGLGAGVWSVIQHLRRGTPLPLTALVAMQLAYLPFALGWLAAGPIGALIWGEWADMVGIGIGAYLAVLAVLVYTAQVALSVQDQPRLWLRLLPLGLVWAGGLAAGFTVNY